MLQDLSRDRTRCKNLASLTLNFSLVIGALHSIKEY
jgi:hypothetical protein